MKVFAMFAAGAVLATVVSAAAFGQTAPPLVYIQPLPPVSVQSVQEHLRSAGSYSGTADGVWGLDSVAALQQFQASHQLLVTGQLNQATALTLGLDPVVLLGIRQVAVPPSLPPPEMLRASSVREIQARMQSVGFYRGGLNGIWNQSTQNAVQQFQQNRGLQPNGQLDAATLSAMGLSPASLAYR